MSQGRPTADVIAVVAFLLPVSPSRTGGASKILFGTYCTTIGREVSFFRIHYHISLFFRLLISSIKGEFACRFYQLKGGLACSHQLKGVYHWDSSTFSPQRGGGVPSLGTISLD